MNFGERIAIISFGASVRVASPLTQDYARLKTIVSGLQGSGGTPMAEALALAIDQLKYTRPFEIGPVTLLPRVILFTDGEPDDKTKVGIVAKAMGDAGLPMVCIGVAGCDQVLMRALAQLSGGMFLMAGDMALLQLFFIRQVLLIAYVMEVKEQLQNLYNRESLRAYLENKTNQPVSDEELDGFVYFLQHLIKTSDKTTGDVQDYTDKGCYSCCCLCTCRKILTFFIFLVCLSAFGWAGYSLNMAITKGYPGAQNSSINTFAVASLITALIFNCGCSVHLIYLRTVDDESILWLVEVLTILFLLVPEVLLFVAVYQTDGLFILPSAITLVSVMGTCCICNCCVRCFSK